jgi:hypothetical protein
MAVPDSSRGGSRLWETITAKRRAPDLAIDRLPAATFAVGERHQ